MKRVLIIAYYWPPSAGSGVQRWLKFSKYLPDNGWQPVIYTPENPDFSLQDAKLLNEIPREAEIIKTKIWEPYQLGRRLFNQKKGKVNSTGIVSGKDKGIKNTVSNWVRGNLFIPDPKVYWRKPSVKFLVNYLKDHPVDIIVSTGTPHSMHLIALDLKRKLNIPWVADFRDPWSELDMLKSYHISDFQMRKYKRMEREVLENADLSVTTSEVWAKQFEELGAKKSEVITNGYDPTDFNYKIEPYTKFVISHFGLLNHLRNPSFLWNALAELCEEDKLFAKDLQINLGGTIDPDNLQEIRKHDILKYKVTVFPYLSHENVVKEYMKSSVLLLLLFDSESGIGNIPGKLFEYLAAKRNILGFGPGKGDSQQIIERTNTGFYFDYSESTEVIKKAIRSLYTNYKNKIRLPEGEIEEYSREALTKKLVSSFEKLIN